MSRFIKKHPNGKTELYYGLDHATGWFYTVVDLEAPEDEDVIEDKNNLFDGLSSGQLALKVHEYEGDLEHVSRILLDLDPLNNEI